MKENQAKKLRLIIIIERDRNAVCFSLVLFFHFERIERISIWHLKSSAIQLVQFYNKKQNVADFIFT